MANEGSTLKERMSEEMKDALRAGEKVRLATLRLLSASVKNREVELRRELTDEEFVEVVGREVKRRNEAIEAYESAGREDLVAKETEERETLQAYMPAQLSDQELHAIVGDAVAEAGASSPSEMGRVMSIVMPRVQGRADGKRVSALVKETLS